MELMDEVRKIINSNYHLYEKIVDPIDLPEHNVDEDWARRNFAVREFYLLRTQGEFVGASSFQKLGDDYAYIGYFYIKNGWHGKGLGTAQMKFLELRAKQENISKILLFANPKADWALKFYEKMGFETILEDKDDILRFESGMLKPYYEQHAKLLMKKLDKNTP